MGVSMALPLLDSMIPAQTALRVTAATPIIVLACIYVPHGATMESVRRHEGTVFEFHPISSIRSAISRPPERLQRPGASILRGACVATVSAGANHTRAAACF